MLKRSREIALDLATFQTPFSSPAACLEQTVFFSYEIDALKKKLDRVLYGAKP